MPVAGKGEHLEIPRPSEGRRAAPRAARRTTVLRSWLPALSAAVFLAWLFVLNFRPATSNDFWIHLRVGEDILRTGEVPRVDDYSAVARGLPFVAHEWLGEVVVAAGVRLFGELSPTILREAAAFALMALLFFALAKPLRRSPLVPPLLALAAYLSCWRIAGRPDLFTVLLAAATALLIERWRRNRRRGELAVAVPLTVLWVNLHGGYLLGIGLLWGVAGCATLAAAFPRIQGTEPAYSWRDAACAAIVAAAASLSTVVNPYGLEMVEHTLRMTRGSDFELMRRIVTEWQPPFAADSYFRQSFPYLVWGFAAQLALLWSALLLRLRARPFFDVFLAAVVTWLGVGANRFIPFAAIVGFPIIVRHGESLLGGNVPRVWARWTLSSVRCLAETAVFAALLMGTLRYGYVYGPTRASALGSGYGGRRPIAEVEYMRALGLQGALYNEIMTDGSYIVHELYPAVRPVMDARVDLVGDERYREYQETHTSVQALFAYLARYDVRLAVVKRDGWITRYLQRSGKWEVLSSSAERQLLRRR